MTNVSSTPRPKRKTSRRANGTGSVSLRPDGAYDVRVSLPNKDRRRRTVRRHAGESAAQHRRRAEVVADALRREIEVGHTIASGHVTVASYAEEWLARERTTSLAGRGRALSTVDFYRQMCDYYVVPHVGTRPLPDLTLADVERMMDSLTEAGYKPRTVQGARQALSILLQSARREGLVSKLATEGASRIRRQVDDADDPTEKALDPAEMKALLHAAEGTRWEPLVSTFAFLGVRRGEALGLCWSEIDLDGGTVSITRSLSRVRDDGHAPLVLGPTKTKGSKRRLHLPPVLAGLLRSWRAEQARERLVCGEAWGNGKWGEHDLVFTTPIGEPVDPGKLQSALDRFGKAAGIGHVYPHQFRHSVASVLIASGHTPPEVAKVMGHSTPAVTLSYYAHAFEEASLRAMDTVADAFGKAATN